MTQRPIPPGDLFDLDPPDWFRPAPDLAEWLRSTFIDEGATLENPDHVHLNHATVACLWTTSLNERAMRRVVGTCELGSSPASKWRKARADQQLIEWFGDVPDFLITIDANFAMAADDATFCAVVEHELYHAGQERDPFGSPKFRKDGSPCFKLRGHDVEEFVGVVRRYGSKAAGVTDLVEAANRPPIIALADIAGVCGTCLAKAA